MELMIVIAAAILAWVIGAIWYRMNDRIYSNASGLQVQNIGHPLSRSVTPYLLAGVALVAIAAMIRILFVRAGIDGIVAGLGWGAGIGAGIVAPWFFITNTYSPRPMVMTLIDMGYAVIACAVVGAVMGGV
ncbi:MULTISPECIES: DUF1761 domain-containing protein [unclassified Paracoccus (in: a-proteobacteria)]|uniref:DUF1761 domain-containing protein n=1 Tax=unclassified Paracoccus (in: a-proteobacteria) TaxID=2688777 RepID=UPI0015FFAC2F|nr:MULTISPECIES: DUF1761 domain-containing protein [unclassified Paracoccus (in: a-proteobacteria)]MBB1490737.1 DUF1761 domain-containing protein [Paracoccus sp. MC1854]MBB1497420.1 DUF1761 domain-containing protein [Paracoccus sp. MC1862]QQO45906.1 DUF1761 domain-containing protein [Paracoccus sp. MC1862]